MLAQNWQSFCDLNGFANFGIPTPRPFVCKVVSSFRLASVVLFDEVFESFEIAWLGYNLYHADVEALTQSSIISVGSHGCNDCRNGIIASTQANLLHSLVNLSLLEL